MTHKAFNLSTGADTGGAAIRSVEAFQAESWRTDWIVRAMVAATNYIQYPEDLPYSRDRLEMEWDSSDVVHLNHTLHGHTWYDAGQGKPIVLEHHGLHHGSFDVDLDESILQGIDIGATQVGSTANLELFGPPGTITWTPIPYDLAALRKMRMQYLRSDAYRSDGSILIAHAPTNREIKSTAAFIDAIEQLKAKHLPVEGIVIEREPHAICLERKVAADIYVDQLKLGYGCNAIESWGMGIPVVGGIEIPAWRDHMVDRWGGMPLVEASESSLASVLLQLVKSADFRAEFAEKGSAHATKWHSQAVHVAQMTDIYEQATPTRPQPKENWRRLRLPFRSKSAFRNAVTGGRSLRVQQ